MNTYTKEKTNIIRKIILKSDNLSNYKMPFIKSTKLLDEIKEYNSVLDWASDQKMYVDMLEKFRSKTFKKRINKK